MATSPTLLAMTGRMEFFSNLLRAGNPSGSRGKRETGNEKGEKSSLPSLFPLRLFPVSPGLFIPVTEFCLDDQILVAGVLGQDEFLKILRTLVA